MQRKKLIWLFNNLDKYIYINEGVAIKEAFSQLLVTKDTLENDDISSKAIECYDKFIDNFYNDILGYQNGLANKNITAETLDCYFVNTGDGYIPIGLYKEERPAETAAIAQTYLEQCKANIRNDRNKAIVGWQNDISNIAEKYNVIKNQKNPSLLKALIGVFCSIPLLFYGIAKLIDIKFYKLNMYNAESINDILKQYSLLEGMGQSGLITLISICIVLIIIAVVSLVNSIREILLLCEKKNTEDVLNTIHSNVSSIEKGTALFIENNVEQCFNAARKGENILVEQNANALLINDVKKKIRKALDYVNKTAKARSAIGNKTFSVIMLAYVCIVSLVVVHLPNDRSNIMSTSNVATTNIKTEQIDLTNTDINNNDEQEDSETNFDICSTDDIISYVMTDYPKDYVTQAPSYNTYHDDEFGFKIDYPAHFEIKTTQSNINRRTYSSNDGSAILKINAGNNEGNITSRNLSEKLISNYGGNVTYNPVKDTWFALSVNDNDDYHYAYYKLDNGEIRGFEFHFTGEENLDTYSKYIDHIYASFKKD